MADGLVSAAKNPAGLEWPGTFLRLCVVPPPAAPRAAAAANAGPAGLPAKGSLSAIVAGVYVVVFYERFDRTRKLRKLNADAHLKNWSLMYPDGRTPQLAPAYDLVGTIPYIPGDRLALSLGETKEFAEVDLDRFRRFAEKTGLPVRLVTQTARETAAAVRDLWPTHEPLRALPKRIREAIAAHMKTVPL